LTFLVKCVTIRVVTLRLEIDKQKILGRFTGGNKYGSKKSIFKRKNTGEGN
jgi:hypothetical protein